MKKYIAAILNTFYFSGQKKNEKTSVCNIVQKTLPGFTLAEILLTISIIGVVAAIAVPTIINSTRDMQLKLAFKKNYGVLAQAHKLAVNDGKFPVTDLLKTLKPYLNYSKYCTGLEKGCWHESNQWKDLDGTLLASIPSSGMILNDGSLLVVPGVVQMSGCEGDPGMLSVGNNICGRILIDVNGFKGPNTEGKDIFGVQVFGSKIRPYGALGTLYSEYNTACDKNQDLDDNGLGCSYKVIQDVEY